ncbi:hypothetical protein CSB09_04660 [Candidatus Gracilibacteria bacterium]|nr:MAG: hypothetical protein CSB09_04660 [Candidatus Gracilibacteria bacterium]
MFFKKGFISPLALIASGVFAFVGYSGVYTFTTTPVDTSIVLVSQYPDKVKKIPQNNSPQGRDVIRKKILNSVALALAAYSIDNAEYPKSHGYCLDGVLFELEGLYLREIPGDPRAYRGIESCPSGFGYRRIKDQDGNDTYVLAAVMEVQKNANSNITQKLFRRSNYPQTFGDTREKINTQENKKNWLYILTY